MNQFTGHKPRKSERCKAAQIRGDEYEDVIWQGVKAIVLNPEEALELANQHMKKYQLKTKGTARKISQLKLDLHHKETERQRVITMTRKGMISLDDDDKQLKAITQEQSALESQIRDIQNQNILLSTFNQQLEETRAILLEAQGQIQDIERTNDRQRMQYFISVMVPDILCETTGTGRQKRFQLRVHFRLGRHTAVDAMNSMNGIYIHENLDLQQLAAERAYEFAYIFSPLRLKGATGSPGNPIAVA